MADKKISQLASGGAPQDADLAPIARGGQNYTWSWANIKTALESMFLSLTGGDLSGDLNFIGDELRIKGDLSNATRKKRLSFQTTTTNGNTLIQTIPNGTGTISGLIAYGSVNPDNSSFLQVHAEDGSHVGLNSSKSGSGVTKDLVFQIEGVIKAYVATNGDFVINNITIDGTNRVIKGAIDVIMVAASDLSTALTTGTNKAYFRAPYAFDLVGLKASLLTASSSGTPTFDVNDNGVSVLSTKLTIDANQTTSVTATVPPVISSPSFANDDVVGIDIDVAGTGATGAIIYLYVIRT